MKILSVALFALVLVGCKAKPREPVKPTYEVMCVDGVMYFTDSWDYPGSPKFDRITKQVMLCN